MGNDFTGSMAQSSNMQGLLEESPVQCVQSISSKDVVHGAKDLAEDDEFDKV